MGFFSRLFGATEPVELIKQPNIVVAYCDDEWRDLAESDARAYASQYSNKYYSPRVRRIANRAELVRAIDKADILHLIEKVDSTGTVNLGSDVVSLAELFRDLASANVKLFWIARDSSAGGLQKVDVKLAPFHFVLTVERRQDRFDPFLRELVAKLSTGLSMPDAWVQLVPQYASPKHESLPGAVFIANRGQAQFLP